MNRRPRRLELGLTDQERRQRDEIRRTRNCFWLLAAIMLVVAILEFPGR